MIKSNIIGAAQDMIDRDIDRDKMYDEIDKMVHGDYDFPDIEIFLQQNPFLRLSPLSLMPRTERRPRKWRRL